MAKLGFGLMRLPLIDKDDNGSIDMKESGKLFDAFMASGFNYFDTAYIYHRYKSETAFRELIKKYPRESYILADKMPTMKLEREDQLEPFFEEQLEKTGAGYFDNYLLHDINISNYDSKIQPFGAFDFVRKKKEEGKIKNLGFSFHDCADLLDRVLTDHPETDFVQLQINYLDWENESIQSRLCYETARKHGKKIIIMEPVKGGTLVNIPDGAKKALELARPGSTPASWALRFVKDLEGVDTVLSGMSDMNQLLENIATFKDESPMNDEEKKALDAAVDIINNHVEIPCTGCSYCTDGCPNSIPIPKYFELYNTFYVLKTKGFSPNFEYYENLIGNGAGKASECIKCGACEEVCPQHLPIRGYLEKVSGLFEN